MLKVISVTMILMAMSLSAVAVEVVTDCPYKHDKAPDGPVAQNAMNASSSTGALTYQNSNVQNPNPAVNGSSQGTN